MFGKWHGWPWSSRKKKDAEPEADGGAAHLALARESLKELIGDTRLPEGIRETLAHDYAQVQAMLDKLEHGHLHIAAYGRVSTGKSSLLNALIGEERFAVSPLHGETRQSAIEPWSEIEAGGVFLIDTPGLDAVCLGPTDLSGSAGVLRQFGHPIVVDGITKVLTAAKKRKLPACLGVIRPDDETRKWVELGANFMITCEDVSTLGAAVRSSLDHMRSIVAK